MQTTLVGSAANYFVGSNVLYLDEEPMNSISPDNRCAPADRGWASDLEQPGQVRVPFDRRPADRAPYPLLGFCAALRECPHEVAQRCLEEAAAGAENFEAVALWPRILARLMMAKLPAPRAEPKAIPRVQIVAGTEATEEFRIWSEARSRLAELCPDYAPSIPQVLAPRSIEELREAVHVPAGTNVPSSNASGSILLVHGAAVDSEKLAQSRRLAAALPVRGAVFRGNAERLVNELARLLGALPDFAPTLDPRYREGVWEQGTPPQSISDLPEVADRHTRDGLVSAALCHLLSMMGLGIEECLYPH